jgi:hypothetical protein
VLADIGGHREDSGGRPRGWRDGACRARTDCERCSAAEDATRGIQTLRNVTLGSPGCAILLAALVLLYVRRSIFRRLLQSQRVVGEMEVSRERTWASARLIGASRDILQDILARAETASDQITQIAAAAGQRRATSNDMTHNITGAADASVRIKDNTHSMLRETAASTDAVNRLVQELGQFGLPASAEFKLDAARIAHLAWVQRL